MIQCFCPDNNRRLIPYTRVHICAAVYSLMMWIPECAQSRAQKNFFSLKGFSEVGTGVMRGSSQECASQYAIRSAAAFDTCRLGMICLRLNSALHFQYSWCRSFSTPFSAYSSFAVDYSPNLIRTLVDCSKRMK